MIKQLLMSSGFWVLNKKIVKKLGIETAFFLSNLAEAENMMSNEDGWFYQTKDTVKDITGLTRYKQDKCIKKLIKLNIIEKDVRGVPAKRYFKIHYNNLQKLIFSNNTQYVNNLQTRKEKTHKLEGKKFTTNKKSNKKHNNKKQTNSSTSRTEANASVNNLKSKTLFNSKDNLKVLENKLNSINKNKNRLETAKIRFKIAKLKNDYSNITFRDISYYFSKIKYKNKYGETLKMQDNYFISDIKKVLESYNIEKRNALEFLMQLVKVYLNKKANERYPTFTSNTLKQDWIISEIGKYAKIEMNKQLRKNNTEKNKSNKKEDTKEHLVF